MAEYEKETFKFPDELEETKGKPAEAEIQIEIEDDTPEEDRNRKPADPEKVKQLQVDVDELDKYSKDAKDKLIQMKRVWNDERRRADAAERERQAALEAAERLLEENNRIKQMLKAGEKDYKNTKKDSAKAQLKAAKQAYKEAYEAGDSEKVLQAQQAMNKAQLALEKAKEFKLPSLQQEKFVVQPQQQYQPAPQPDDKLSAWMQRNPWFGQDEEMTAAAHGLHDKMRNQGMPIGTDEYYETLEKTIRKRFPENFEESSGTEVEQKPKADTQKAKPTTVVASATRSTAPKRIRLTTSQVTIAKRLGLSPEQYVRELMKLEA